jgi:hypothetical protein
MYVPPFQASQTVPKVRFIPELKLRDLVPNSYIHVYVRDLYVLRIGLPIWLQQNRRTDPGNI